MKYQTCQLACASALETEKFAEHVGRRLKGGELLELASDLGGGKTTFTKGLAKGAGSNDSVASPTFTISRVYAAPKFQIHHFDFYRLPDAGLAAHELHELIDDEEVVLVVEWADVVEHILPEKRLTITITQTGENSRQFDCRYPADLAYLLEGLC
jgi:tRNA threonylcarbamoyladenosine biosynthesis protein TsaE